MNNRAIIGLLLTITLIGLSKKIHAQKSDIWTGNYVVRTIDSQPIDSLRIEKVGDANKDDVASKFDSDLKRWVITSKNDDYDDEIEARRFLYDIENDENEYEQFGWTELYLNEEMKCLDAGHLFLCKTKPESTVQIDDESFFTKTGIFGIRLHYGLFILEKY